MPKEKRFNVSTPKELGDRIDQLAEELGISRSQCCRQLMQAGLDIRSNKGVISDEQVVIRSLANLSLAGLIRVSLEISTRLLKRLPSEVAEKTPVERNTVAVLIEQNLDSVSRFFLAATNGEERLRRILGGERPRSEDLPLIEAGLPSTTRQQLEEICEKEFEHGNSGYTGCGKNS